MLVAGDRHDIGPIGRLHEYSGDVCASHMEGRGAVLIGALDAGTAGLLGALVAVDALLQGIGGGGGRSAPW